MKTEMDVDIDNDLDGKLLQQFSSMGTQDRDVLISEFQKLLNNDLNPSCCSFFLDMNNWNLQAAICSYYDFEQPSSTLPRMMFVSDVTIGEGESIPPNTTFIKTWRIKNGGLETWPPGCCLKFCNGDTMSHVDRVMVDALEPSQMTDVSIQMTSPATKGVYQGQWRMSTPTGVAFGDVIWVIITVDESGLLGVTQQLSRIGNEFVNRIPPQTVLNPFASPDKLPEAVQSSPSPSSSIIVNPGSPVNDLSPAAEGAASSKWLFQSSVRSPSQQQIDNSQDTEMS
ncbi:protein ILRUN-like [Gigantopelta aegis]|uniref:protein ILRUN-like n=1 Tax=Gigantopelta aegis TaxID=1735272 RepID=UPI001B88D341|nr:protein ILRUN-like [Gigantopelta aegis]